ncbi:MAG: T9SS type A sorting domain-containing protein [Bacteroidetes bacterium]|nr:T9SS type A sorting domain-containing protein [Bacteroidota bacterium]
MKKIYLLIFFLAMILSSHSQEIWGPPFPLTDSLTDNVNPTLSILPGDIIQPDSVFMLWERSSDTITTAIYARNLKTMGTPFLAAGQVNSHFKHPRVFRRGYSGDTLFLFSYETDMNGNWDLYYSILMKNETTLGPFPFIRSALNEKNLNFGDPQSFSWEKEGIIYVKATYSDTTELAAGNCANPVISGENYVAYEFPTGGAVGAFFSKYNLLTHLWDGPYPMDIYGTNSHLTFGNDSYGSPFSSYVFWQHKDGTYWQIKGFDADAIMFCSFNNFPGCNNMTPSFCDIEMITDGFPLTIPFSTFASDFSGNMEVYVNPSSADTTYENISVYPGEDRHPQLFNNVHFTGRGIDNQLFDIWESNHGGHWQLWTTRMDILSGVASLKDNRGGWMTIVPNPFTEKTRIEFFTKETGSQQVDIFDLEGNKIRSLESTPKGNGVQSVSWDGKDAGGVKVPAGVYLCSVKTGGSVLHRNIILY